MPKQYTCLQCDKMFKRKSYRLKHVINQHQFFQCEICKQNVKLGSRTVHVLRCKQREHIKMPAKSTARSPPPLVYEDKGLQVTDGTVAPPTTPEQQVPEEIEKIVQELKNLEEATQNIQEQATQKQMPENSAEQLMDISSDDLVKFNDFDFNLLLL